MHDQETIVSAGNTEVPCYLSIIALGYNVTKIQGKTENDLFVAENKEFRFIASSQIELLGLICMRTKRGSNWKASDDEIKMFLSSFCSDDKEKT